MSKPIYKQIHDDLFEKIVSGQLREGDRIPSESELVRQYYVSAITVKNALHMLEDGGLIERIKGKGSFVIKSPYSTSWSEASQKQRTIGVIFPNASSIIVQTYGMYISELCQKYNLLVNISYSQESTEKEEALLRHHIKNGVQGILLFPAVSENNNPSIHRLLIGDNGFPAFPLVFLDRYLDRTNASYVSSDNAQGALLATEYVIAKVNDEMSILHFPLSNSAVTERYNSFRNAFRSAGLHFGLKNECLIDDRPLISQKAEDRIRFIMNSIQNHLRTYPAIRGLFCVNAEIAQVAYYTVLQMQKTPGEDFEIVSFDEPYLPGVHFIQQDFKSMCQQALACLIRQIEGDRAITQIRIPTRFVHMETHSLNPKNLHYLIKSPSIKTDD